MIERVFVCVSSTLSRVNNLTLVNFYTEKFGKESLIRRIRTMLLDEQ